MLPLSFAQLFVPHGYHQLEKGKEGWVSSPVSTQPPSPAEEHFLPGRPAKLEITPLHTAAGVFPDFHLQKNKAFVLSKEMGS